MDFWTKGTPTQDGGETKNQPGDEQDETQVSGTGEH